MSSLTAIFSRRAERARPGRTGGRAGLAAGRFSSSGIPVHVPVLLSALLLAAPLMVGSVHPWSTVLLASGAFFAWVLILLFAPADRLPLPLLAWIGCGLLLWLGVTMLPWPRTWFTVAAPALAELWDFEPLSPLVGPSMTASPGPTSFEIVKLGGAIATLLVASCLAATRVGQRWLLWSIVGSGVAVALLSTAQTLATADKVLGFYEPVSGGLGGFRTTFVNPNHAAQFFELCGFTALGAAIALRGRPRLVAVAAGALLLGAVVATGSFGGRIASIAGLVFVGTLAVSNRMDGWRHLRWLAPAGVSTLLLVAVGASLTTNGDPGLASALLSMDERKLAHMPGVLELIREHPWFGVGRGAFGAMFSLHQPSNLFQRYLFAESEPLQLAAELGIPLAIGLLVAIVGAWVFAAARWSGNPYRAGALAGVGVAGIHNLLGFGLEFAGVGLPFAVGLALLVVGPDRLPSGRGGRRTAWAMALLVAISLLASPLALRHGTVRREMQHLDTAAREGGLEAAIERGLRWHPLSPDYSFAVFDILVATDPSASLRYLNRTMILAPGDATPHLAAAETLAVMGYGSQAAIEAGLALEMNDGLQGRLFPLLEQILDDANDVPRYLSSDVARIAAFTQYLQKRDSQDPRIPGLVAWVRAESPDGPEAALLLANVDWLEGRRDEALSRLESLAAERPDDVDLCKTRGQLLRIAGEHDDSLQVVETCLEHVGEHPGLLYQLASTQLELEQHGNVHKSLRRLRKVTPPTSASGMAALARLEGDLALAEDRPEKARERYLESLRYRPEQNRVRLELGKVERELGRDRNALNQFRKVRERSDAYPYLDDWIQELEDKGVE